MTDIDDLNDKLAAFVRLVDKERQCHAKIYTEGKTLSFSSQLWLGLLGAPYLALVHCDPQPIFDKFEEEICEITDEIEVSQGKSSKIPSCFKSIAVTASDGFEYSTDTELDLLELQTSSNGEVKAEKIKDLVFRNADNIGVSAREIETIEFDIMGRHPEDVPYYDNIEIEGKITGVVDTTPFCNQTVKINGKYICDAIHDAVQSVFVKKEK